MHEHIIQPSSALMTFTYYDGKIVQEAVQFPTHVRFCTIGSESIKQCERITRIDLKGLAHTVSSEWYSSNPKSLTYSLQTRKYAGATDVEKFLTPYFLNTGLHSRATEEQYYDLIEKVQLALENMK
jgi:hypothetical protein